MEKKVTIGSVCFIKNPSSDSILLLERAKNPMKGMWTGVGGKTAFDEDIKTSCLREVKEETGLTIDDLRLKGVVKTIFQRDASSWILFVYSATAPQTILADCDEGVLRWTPLDELHQSNLIGFIRPLIPIVLSETGFCEGTIIHDEFGHAISIDLSSS